MICGTFTERQVGPLKLCISKQVAAVTLATGMIFSGMAAQAQYGSPQGPPRGPQQGPGGYQNPPRGQNGPAGGWDVAPPEFREAARQGYRDGIYGAQKDVENRRRPNVNNRDEYRNPRVGRPFRKDYRMGFQRGYDNAMRHMIQGGPAGYR